MKRRSILIAGAVTVSVIIIFFSSLPLLVRPDFLERLIRDQVEKQLGYSPSFERYRLSFFPLPVIHFYQCSITQGSKEAEPILKAERVSVRPSLLSLLMGRAEFAGVSLRDAVLLFPSVPTKGTAKPFLTLEHVNADFHHLKSGEPVHFKIKGRFLSPVDNFNLGGTITADFAKFRPEDLVLDVNGSLNGVAIEQLGRLWEYFPVKISKGTASFSGKAVKKKGASELDAEGLLKIQDLVYEAGRKPVQSSAANYELLLKAGFDTTKKLLVLREGTLNTPFGGPFQINGQFNVSRQSFDELFVRTETLRLDLIPQYVVFLTEILPVNLGFSGQSRLDLAVKGDVKMLELDLRVDSTQATLSYSKYFSKPAGAPFVFRGDVRLVAGTVLRGSFSVDFDQAAAKGSIVDWDLSSRNGEITVLTNNFTVKGWEQFFPPIRQLSLNGGLKLLFSAKGNFNRIRESNTMATHVTFDDLGIKSPGGSEIKNVNGSIDLGSLDSEVNQFSVQIGKSAFTANGKMFLKPEKRWLLQVQAPEVNVRDVVNNLRGIAEATELSELRFDWVGIEKSISFIRPETSYQKLEAQVVFGENRLMVPEAKLEAYGGTVSGRGLIDFSKERPSTEINFDLNRLSLARMGPSTEKPLVEGNFFAAGSLVSLGPLDAKWAERLTGQGSLGITNGEFHTFDLLGGLGQIAQLALLGKYQSGSTKFNDMRGSFTVGEKKVQTKDLFFVSEDFQIDAAGDVGFDGKLNYRLAVYLMPNLAQTVSSGTGATDRLGPIPILLVGTIDKPVIQRDPVLLQTFLDQLVQKQFSKIISKISSPKSAGETASDTKETSTTGDKDFKKALVDSGFAFLEQFLTEKKSADQGSASPSTS